MYEMQATGEFVPVYGSPDLVNAAGAAVNLTVLAVVDTTALSNGAEPGGTEYPANEMDPGIVATGWVRARHTGGAW